MNQTLPRNVFVLSTVVILATLAAALTIIFAFVYSSRSDTFSQLRGILLVLLCFVFSSASLLLFSVSKVEIKGTFKVIGITLAGPAVLWVAAFVVLNNALPEFSGPPPLTFETVGDFLYASERADGSLTYPQWLKDLGTAASLFNANEEYRLRELLTFGYYRGRDKIKPTNPEIETLFVYLKGSTGQKGLSMKFQHVFAHKTDVSADVYVTVAPTIPGNKPSAVLFLKQGKNITAYTDLETKWITVTTEPVDYLIVALYENDEPDHGDYLVMPSNAYVAGGGLRMNLGVISERDINDAKTRMWTMRQTKHNKESDVPLLFKRVDTAPSKDIRVLSDALGEWFGILDEHLKRSDLSPKAVEFLSRVRDQLPHRTASPATFKSFLNDPRLASTFAYHLDKLRESAIVTFEWR